MSELFNFTGKIYYVGLYKNFCTLLHDDDSNDFIGIKYVGTKEHPRWEFDTSVNKDENCYIENYANKLASVSLSKISIIVTKKDDKISLKLFLYHRNRVVGKPYFKLSTICYFFTYNFKTNAIYKGSIQDYHKKRKFKRKIRRILTYGDPLLEFKQTLVNNFRSDFIEEYSEIKRDQIIDEAINSFIKNIPDIEKYKTTGLKKEQNVFYKMFFDKYGVKLPNNWENLIFDNLQPKKIDYVKNDYKYVDSFMLANKIKGRKLRKIIHNVDKLTLTNLHLVFNNFGEEYVMNQNESLIKSILECSELVNHNLINFNKLIKTKKEFDNVFEIFKLVIDGKIGNQTFNDHANFYGVVNKYEDIKWLSNTYDDFQKEHLDWTDKMTFYTMANHDITYDQTLVNELNKPIIINEQVYYPVLLTNSKEYNRESTIQSNCVRTYIERPTSLIISLRKNNIESQDRATIEYRVLFVNERFKFNRVQTLGRFNKTLPEEWNEPIRELDDVLNTITKYNKLKPQTIITKKGNKEFKRELIIQKNETSATIRWDSNVENSEDSIYYLV